MPELLTPSVGDVSVLALAVLVTGLAVVQSLFGVGLLVLGLRRISC